MAVTVEIKTAIQGVNASLAGLIPVETRVAIAVVASRRAAAILNANTVTGVVIAARERRHPQASVTVAGTRIRSPEESRSRLG